MKEFLQKAAESTVRRYMSVAEAGMVTLDIHGMNTAQARAAVAAALRRCGGSVYRLRVVHGYNRGTELRDMVRGEFAAHSRVIRMEQGANPGVTELVLREL